MTIAVLGLGAMGARMATRLVDAGHDVVVWNRTASRADALVERGARLAASPRAAAAVADVVLSVVTNIDASRAVWLDPETGAAAGLRSGAVAVEASTVTPAWIQELSAALASTPARFIEAPVVGTRPHAEKGILTILVGGDAAALALAQPALAVLGRPVHVGALGQGMAAKLVINALFGIQAAALAESLATLERAGLERAAAVELLGNTAVASPVLKLTGALMASGSYAPLFPIDLVEKDLGYMVSLAESLGTTAPTTAAARAVFGRASAAGHGGDNIHGVIQLFD